MAPKKRPKVPKDMHVMPSGKLMANDEMYSMSMAKKPGKGAGKKPAVKRKGSKSKRGY